MFSVIENSLNLDAVKLEALYLVKLIFGEYFYLDSNRVAVLLQLQRYLDANRVLVRERVNEIGKNHELGAVKKSSRMQMLFEF